jgi:DNA polymerase III sliding clamp (beta) subunit (PCNA family)
MIINRAELQTALEAVRPGLASKDVIEQSTSFAFMEDRIVTYNDEISVSYPFKGLGITGVVKAEALYQFLSKVKQDEIDLDPQENELRIKAGRINAGLVFESEIRLPVEEVGNIDKWKDVPDGLLSAFKLCHPCASKDMSRPMLTCIHVDGARVEAGESYQVMRVELSSKVPIDTFLIPANSAREVARYKMEKIAGGNGWVHFKSADGMVFSCRVFDGDFPDTSNILQIDDGLEVTFSAKMMEALERSDVFSKTGITTDAEVRIAVEQNKVTVAAKNEFGWFEESLRVKYDGDKFSFRTSPELLVNGLKAKLTCFIGGNRIKFTGENWQCVIAATVDDAQ